MEPQLNTTTSATASNAAEPRLGRLPAEMHVAIAEQLALSELKSLRQVCRSLAADTHDVLMAHRYHFRRYCVTPSLVSMFKLQALHKVSQIPGLARHVKDIELHSRPSSLAAPLKYFDDLLLADFKSLARFGSAKKIKIAVDCTPVNTALVALAESGLNVGTLTFQFAQSSASRSFPISDSQLSQIQKMCSGVEVLILRCHNHQQPTLHGMPPRVFASIICACAKLQRLHMECMTFLRPTLMDLSTTTLRHLEVADSGMDDADLIRFLGRHKRSLRALHLSDVVLWHNGSWKHMMTWLHQHTHLSTLSFRLLTCDRTRVVTNAGVNDAMTLFVDSTKVFQPAALDDTETNWSWYQYSLRDVSSRRPYKLKVSDDSDLVKVELGMAARNGLDTLFVDEEFEY